MQNMDLIPNSLSPQIFRYRDSVYCVDPERPAAIRINRDIERILCSGKGMTAAELIEAFPDSKPAVRELVNLVQDGFFRESTETEPPALHGIRKLCFAVSGACNFGCRYCYESNPSGKAYTGFMSREIARRAVDYLVESASAGPLEIDFFGGEPLLNLKVVRDVVNYCATKEREFRFSITTNGSLVNRAIADFLRTHNFSVVLSLDGPEYVHDAMRLTKHKGRTFKVVLRGFEILKQRIPPAKLTCTGVLTRQFPFPAKLLREYERMGVPRVALNSVSAPGNGEIELDREAMHSIAEDERVICENIIASKAAPATKYLPIAQYMRFLGRGERRRTRCGAGIDNVTVSPDGRLYLCHRFLDNERFELGDVWRGIDEQKRRAMFADRPSPLCPDCWARFICGGPCIHDSWTYTGSMHGIVPAKCERIRHLIELATVTLGELMKKDRPLVPQYL